MPAPITEYQVRKLNDKIRQVESLRRVCGQISMDTLTIKLDIGSKYLEQILDALDMSESGLVQDLGCKLATMLRDRLTTEQQILQRMLHDPAWEPGEEETNVD